MTTELDTRDLAHIGKYLKGGSYRLVADQIYNGELFTTDLDVACALVVGLPTGRKYASAIRLVAGCGVEETAPRRQCCSAKAFVAALRSVCAEQIERANGRDILMSDRVRDEVSTMLFLDAVGFSRMLLACINRTGYLKRGTTSGSYGIFVTFPAQVEEWMLVA